MVRMDFWRSNSRVGEAMKTFRKPSQKPVMFPQRPPFWRRGPSQSNHYTSPIVTTK
jgi:hypothetical protein